MAYNGRRGPNVAQYIADLNTIPSAQDMAAQQQPGVIEDDLALFTNTEFFDFDLNMGEIPELGQQPLDYDPAQEERARRQNASAYRHNHTGKPNDFMSGGDFHFSGYNFPNLVDPATASYQTQQQQAQFNLPAPTQQSSPSLASPISPSASTVAAGTKHKLDTSTDPNGVHSIEDPSRLAAEEDKRRRNTAASARFRIKKKQREQALEKSAKEMSDKVSDLENKISQLETENRWLKSLLTEKNEKSAEVSTQRLHKESTEARSLGGHTTGVGTDSKAAKA